MLLHATHDESVPIVCLQESVDGLLDSGHQNVTYHTLFAQGHGDDAEVHQHMREFLLKHLPRLDDAAKDASAPPPTNVPARSKSVIKMGGRRAGAAGGGIDSEPAAAAIGPQLMPSTGSSSSSSSGTPALGPQPPPQPQLPPPPEYTISDADGALKVVVALPPSVEGMASLDLQMDESGMELAAADGSSMAVLRVRWPTTTAPLGLNTDGASARFSKKKKELRVVVPHHVPD